MRKQLFMGIDTSCYMTSVACLIDDKVIQYRKPVEVKTGNCGLRQSEALFQHIKNLPVLFNSFRKDFNVENYEISCVSVSTRPRSVDGSYMPVFIAGEGQARILSDVLSAKLFETSHQDGHIMSVIYTEKEFSLLNEPFLSVHLSGGTSEILLCEYKDKKFCTQIVGGTKDLPAGQFIDRIGVLMGYQFPSGKFLDANACSYSGKLAKSPLSVKDGYFNFSGEETKIRRLYQNGEIVVEDASFMTMNFISETLKKAVLDLKDKHKINKVIMAGGVSSSNFLRNNLKDIPGIIFSAPEYSGDNAVGVAALGKLFTCGLG